MNYENEFGVCLRSYTIKLEKEEYALYCWQCLTIKHGCKTLPRKSFVLRNTSEMYSFPVLIFVNCFSVYSVISHDIFCFNFVNRIEQVRDKPVMKTRETSYAGTLCTHLLNHHLYVLRAIWFCVDKLL